MAELPTVRDIERLYFEKKYDALVWYAWRNALRALPILGKHSLIQIWQQDTVQYAFVLSRVCLILAQRMNIPIEEAIATAYGEVSNFADNFISDTQQILKRLTR